MPDPEEPDEPDLPEEPDEPDDPEPLLDEPVDPLRPLWPLCPVRLSSPLSSSEPDGSRKPSEELRMLPSPGEALSRMPPCDEEPDCPCRPDEPDCPDCWSLCEPDRPDDPLIPPWFPPWFTFDEPEFLSRSVIWRTSF
jgi:hypothetical protein